MMAQEKQRILAEMCDWAWPTLLLCTVLFLSAGLSLASHAGAAGEPTLAVYPPWWDEARVLQAVIVSGAGLVAMGPADWLVVTVSTKPETVEALREGGAVMLMTPVASPWCAP